MVQRDSWRKKKSYSKPAIQTKKVSFLTSTVASSGALGHYGPYREAPRREK